MERDCSAFDVLPSHNALAEERKSERQKAEDGRLINRGLARIKRIHHRAAVFEVNCFL